MAIKWLLNDAYLVVTRWRQGKSAVFDFDFSFRFRFKGELETSAHESAEHAVEA